MPKLLVVFVGHMRSFAKVADSLNDNLVSLTQADCALVTRTCRGYARHDGEHQGQNANPLIAMFENRFRPKISRSFPMRKLPDNYIKSNPHACSWAFARDRGKHLTNVSHLRSSIQGALGMFELLKLASDSIRDIARNYDLIMRCRPDVMLKSPFPVEGLHVSMENPNVIVGPDYCNLEHAGGINDQIFCGRPEAMLDLMSIYDRLPKYIADGQVMHPEPILGHHLRCLGLSKMDLPINYKLKRDQEKMRRPHL
jgi:hypothetical protein